MRNIYDAHRSWEPGTHVPTVHRSSPTHTLGLIISSIKDGVSSSERQYHPQSTHVSQNNCYIWELLTHMLYYKSLMKGPVFGTLMKILMWNRNSLKWIITEAFPITRINGNYLRWIVRGQIQYFAEKYDIDYTTSPQFFYDGNAVKSNTFSWKSSGNRSFWTAFSFALHS